jgi:peptidoglycan/xylan/chitin deacetylase (PgdA/CDA1 family)
MLTFDNGPTPGVTRYVLDVLAERQLPATFFAVGVRLSDASARVLLGRARAEGHQVGNHSMHHRVPLGEDPSPDAVEREIVAAQAALGELAGPAHLFRPFGKGGELGPHLFSRSALDHLCAHRYTVVLWNSVPRDWEDPSGWPERARVDIDANDHTVLVLHDLPTGAMEALPAFLDALLDDGVTFTLDVPDSCAPVRDGAIRWSVDHLVGVS